MLGEREPDYNITVRVLGGFVGNKKLSLLNTEDIQNSFSYMVLNICLYSLYQANADFLLQNLLLANISQAWVKYLISILNKI